MKGLLFRMFKSSATWPELRTGGPCAHGWLTRFKRGVEWFTPSSEMVGTEALFRGADHPIYVLFDVSGK